MAKQWKVGIVGARGLSTIEGFQGQEDVRVEALCDLREDLLIEQSQKCGIPKTYRVFEDLLASDVDIVVVATPMQLHAQQTIAALEAGKHVLSEVTAAVTLEELWWLLETVKKSRGTYMMAENYCYIPQVQQVLAMAREGLFGETYFAEGEYLHELKHMARNADGTSTWRRFWQLGQSGNFYPTHSLGPLMQWMNRPRIQSVICCGSGHHTAPGLQQEDTSLTLCQLEGGKLIKLRLDCVSERPHNLTYYTLQGTKGCYEAPRGLGDAHKVWLKGMDADTDHAAWRPLTDFDQYLPDRYKNATEAQRRTGHWGGDYFIIDDFMQAVKQGTRPPVDIHDACEWTAVAMLSQQSIAQGGKVIDMPDFRK